MTRYRCTAYRPVRTILTTAGVSRPNEVCRSFRDFEVLAENRHRTHPKAHGLRMKIKVARKHFHKTLKAVPLQQKDKALEIAKAKAPQLHRMAWIKTIGMGLFAMTSAYGLLEGTLAKPFMAIMQTIGIRAKVSEVIAGGICILGAVAMAYARESFKKHTSVKKFITALEAQQKHEE